jgi:hypothetical protein
VKRTGILAALLTTALLLSTFGCGGAAIGNLTAINLTIAGGGVPNLKGEGGTVQLVATGIYSSTNTQDISSRVTYVVTANGVDLSGAPLPAPPQTVTISPTGLMTAVPPFTCSWTDLSGGGATPSWFLMGSYQVVANYKGISSQPVFIGVASAAGDGQNGTCGP